MIKLEKIIWFCDQFQGELSFSIQTLAQFIGTLVASLSAVQSGSLFYRYLELDSNKALKKSRGNSEVACSLSPKSMEEINWWKNNISIAFKNITILPPDEVLTSEVSRLGW